MPRPIPVQTIVQGLIDRSEGLHNETVVAKANKAIQQIEECQLCGDKGHQAKQCKVFSKELRVVSKMHSDRRTS